MTAREYMDRGYRLNIRITCDQRLLEDLQSKSASVMDGVRVQGGKLPEGRASVLEKLIDLQDKVNAEIDSYVDIINELRATIEELPDSRERFVLTSRFINYDKFAQIAEALEIDIRHVFRVYNRAMEHVTGTDGYKSHAARHGGKK